MLCVAVCVAQGGGGMMGWKEPGIGGEGGRGTMRANVGSEGEAAAAAAGAVASLVLRRRKAGGGPSGEGRTRWFWFCGGVRGGWMDM